MKSFRTWWLAVLGLLIVPQVVLLVAGTVWLYERGLLLYWIAGGGVLTLVGWGLARRLQRKNLSPIAPTVQPALTWPPSGHAAWEDVEVIAQRVQTEDLPLDRPDVLWQILLEVLEAVAAHYHPKSDRAALEIPAPHVLRVVELVAYDLRKAFSEHLPWSHVLTLGDFLRLKRLAAWAQELYFLYRVARLGYNPVSALLVEIRGMALGRLQNTSADGIKRWAAGFCVQKAGYYAIQLYGGHLLLDDVQFEQFRTAKSKDDLRQQEDQSERVEEEPLRIMVLGQVKSGKSSLINALFGETRAAVDVVPRTRGVEPHLLERDGVPRAIILDTGGYETADGSDDPFTELREQVLDSDLLLVVCSAGSAARAADRRLLDAVRSFFQEEPDRVMPPLIVAVSHVDQLRPLNQWDPPYDLAEPDCPKAEQIAEVLRAVREDLSLCAEEPALPVCLKAGQLYNVEEGLAPLIVQSVSQAERVRYLRCLRHYHEEEYWQRLWQQAVNSGRLMLKVGKDWVRGTGRK